MYVLSAYIMTHIREEQTCSSFITMLLEASFPTQHARWDGWRHLRAFAVIKGK